MNIVENIPNLFVVAFRALVIGALFMATTSCSDQEDLIENETAATATQTAAEATSDINEAASLTVAGAFVEYKDVNACAECTYVIPEDATVVDGAELGIKAGDVICLKSTFKYKAVEVVNVEGTADAPVVIANCNE